MLYSELDSREEAINTIEIDPLKFRIIFPDDASFEETRSERKSQYSQSAGASTIEERKDTQVLLDDLSMPNDLSYDDQLFYQKITARLTQT